MAGAGGIGYLFNLAPTCSTRVPNDINFLPRWRKSLLLPRPGEGGRENSHPAQGRAFLRWSRYETAYVAWQEITGMLDVERGSCTPLSATFLLRS